MGAPGGAQQEHQEKGAKKQIRATAYGGRDKDVFDFLAALPSGEQSRFILSAIREKMGRPVTRQEQAAPSLDEIKAAIRDILLEVGTVKVGDNGTKQEDDAARLKLLAHTKSFM